MIDRTLARRLGSYLDGSVIVDNDWCVAVTVVVDVDRACAEYTHLTGFYAMVHTRVSTLFSNCIAPCNGMAGDENTIRRQEERTGLGANAYWTWSAPERNCWMCRRRGTRLPRVVAAEGDICAPGGGRRGGGSARARRWCGDSRHRPTVGRVCVCVVPQPRKKKGNRRRRRFSPGARIIIITIITIIVSTERWAEKKCASRSKK